MKSNLGTQEDAAAERSPDNQTVPNRASCSAHQNAIIENLEELKEHMDVEIVEDYMITKGMLPLNKRKEWKMEVTRRRRSLLLEYVYDKDLDVFIAFREGLVKAKQTHLANKLEL